MKLAEVLERAAADHTTAGVYYSLNWSWWPREAAYPLSSERFGAGEMCCCSCGKTSTGVLCAYGRGDYGAAGTYAYCDDCAGAEIILLAVRG